MDWDLEGKSRGLISEEIQSFAWNNWDNHDNPHLRRAVYLRAEACSPNLQNKK